MLIYVSFWYVNMEICGTCSRKIIEYCGDRFCHLGLCWADICLFEQWRHLPKSLTKVFLNLALYEENIMHNKYLIIGGLKLCFRCLSCLFCLSFTPIPTVLSAQVDIMIYCDVYFNAHLISSLLLVEL